MGKKKAERFEFDVKRYENEVEKRGLNYAQMGDKIGRCHTWLAPTHGNNKNGFTKAQLAVLRDSFNIDYSDIKPINKQLEISEIKLEESAADIESAILNVLMSEKVQNELEKTIIRAVLTTLTCYELGKAPHQIREKDTNVQEA